ncbi:MAG: leucine-rich repeat protein [Ruminococcus sp.]
MKRIGAMAFNSCKGFSGDLIIPDSVEVIELGAFVNCTGFDGKVILSQNLKKIGESSFCNCYNLSEVVFGENVTEIGDYAFEECTRLTERMILPSKLKSIGKKAFYHCFRLNGALNIPNSVEEIGDNAFDGCTGIKAFYIPNSVKKMGRGCIPQYDDGVFSLIYGNSGSEAEKYAKDNRICFSNLDDEMAGTNIIKCGDNAIFGIKYDEIKNGIVWSVEGYGDMKQENPLNDGTYEQYADYLEISPEITSIGDYSLCQFEKVEDGIVFPGSLTSIGDHAFSNCSKFTGELIFPETLKSIGDYAFGDCSKFTGELIFPETLKNIGCMAFYYCEGLNGTVNIPGSVELIKEATFLECKNITSVVLHEGTTKIDNSAFSGCKSLQSIEIPMSVVKIKETAFDGCPNLTIHGYTGSYAEQFAKENLIPFKAIPKTDISSVSIRGVENQYYYTGSEIKPEVTVMFGDKKLELEKDYTVTYTNNTNLGTATVTITGTGLYEGNKNVDFAIVEKDHQWNEWQEIKAATYKEVGTQQRKCNICGKTENKEIAKLTCTNHVWSNWSIVKAASISEEGVQQHICEKCGATENSSIPKLTPTPTVTPTDSFTVTVTKGKTTTLKPDSSWKNVKYSSSNKKIATVDKKGKVKAVAAGIVKITVKFGSKSVVYTITVPGTTAIKGIKSSVSIKKGKSYTLKPKLSYTEKADKVTYKSSNKKIATVSKKVL